MSLSSKTLEDLRVEYRLGKLDLDSITNGPVEFFRQWLAESIKAECIEPSAFVLSTSVSNTPRSRVLLLKGVDEGKFIFFTNYKSDKGQEIEQNSRVAMNFHWPLLERQVRIEGVATKIDTKKSQLYFQSRPRGSQIGAHASPQSQRIVSREELEERFLKFEKMFENKDITLPDHWGGYAVSPLYIEFWQGRENRLHDRIACELEGANWSMKRLAP